MVVAILDVKAETPKIETHLLRVDRGDYQLPEFQRTFVWDNERILKLWDSLYNGYPIGQIMLWEPDEVDFPMRSLGYSQEEVKPSKNVVAIIDGQQRLTALQLVLNGNVPLKFDLREEKFTYSDGPDSLRLDILRDAEGNKRSFDEAGESLYFEYHASESQKKTYAKQINRLKGILSNREIPNQTIRHSEYSTVLDIFKRSNIAGLELSEAQLTMAGISRCWPGVFRRTYELLKKMNLEMGFDQIEDPTFVFQVWTAVHTEQHLVKHLAPESPKSKYYGMMRSELYESSWKITTHGIDKLISLMRDELDLTNFRFIRSYYPLSVAAYYLATHIKATDEEKDKLKRWLILSLVSGRYHERALSKYGADIRATRQNKDISALFKHKNALDLETASHHLSPDKLRVAGFRSAYVTLLYMICRKTNAVDWKQSEFRVGDPLPIDNSPWHFHHIFPDETFDGQRADLRNMLEEAQAEGEVSLSQEIEEAIRVLEDKITSVANLAFLTPRTNIQIGNRLPSDYLAEIASTEGGIASLEQQLIPMNRELWKHNKFEEFCKARSELIISKAKEFFF
ncbi:MAG TPA: DUF262 domain-containing protein [bacterium]|nr:DUF262 domain-containing protein [bacterium]